MVIQFVLYDKLKAMALQYKNIDPHSPHAIDSLNVFEYLGLASVAKLIASISTYPHEVICLFLDVAVNYSIFFRSFEQDFVNKEI